MLKRVLFLLLVVVWSEASLVAHDAGLSNCPTLEATDLFTSDLDDTSVWLNYTSSERAINQFRFRESDTHFWKYSSITADATRFFSDLHPATQYEFQVSYICSAGSWTAFSASATFTTLDDSTIEENEEEESHPEEEMMDTTQVDSMYQDSVLVDSILQKAYLQIGDGTASCGDSLVCVPVYAVGQRSKMIAMVTWEVDILQFLEIQIADTFATSLFYQTDSMNLSNGQVPLLFTKDWSNEFSTQDTLAVAAICFQPNFDQATMTSVEFGTTRMYLEKDATTTDTLMHPNAQAGDIELISCEGIHLGGGTCDPIDGIGLTTSSVTETTAYIYNSHHNLDLNNQFRYRIKGDINWMYTDVQQSHFRRLLDLQPGTTYEFQANQECADGSFSDYSFSFYFSTHGDSGERTDNEGEAEIEIITDGTCERLDSTELTVSTIKQYFAYVYAPQPLGPVNNQFRYRIVGTSFWFYTSISPTYYRWLRGLQDGTLYEYQVSHECSEGLWSPYSGSYQFTTLPSINLNEQSTSRTKNKKGQIGTEIKLFPNPTTDFLMIAGADLAETQITLRDISGKLLQQLRLTDDQPHQISMQEYPAGMYFLDIQKRGELQSLKVIKTAE